jgi:hypothetical protein
MSNLSSAAAALSGVPEDLVQRSAEARAAASGSSAEEVLTAWGGGAPAPQAAVAEPPPTAAPTPASAQPAPPQEAAAAVAVVEQAISAPEVIEEDLPPVEMASTRARLSKARILGMGFGLVTGLAAGLLGLLIMIPSLSIVEGVLVGSTAPRKIVFGAAIIMAISGRFIALASTKIPAAINRSYELEDSAREIKLTGVVTGLALGLALGTLIKRGGSPDILDSTIQIVPVMSSFVTMLIGAGVIGAIIGMLSQIVALPDAPRSDDDH